MELKEVKQIGSQKNKKKIGKSGYYSLGVRLSDLRSENACRNLGNFALSETISLEANIQPTSHGSQMNSRLEHESSLQARFFQTCVFHSIFSITHEIQHIFNNNQLPKSHGICFKP